MEPRENKDHQEPRACLARQVHREDRELVDSMELLATTGNQDRLARMAHLGSQERWEKKVHRVHEASLEAWECLGRKDPKELRAVLERLAVPEETGSRDPRATLEELETGDWPEREEHQEKMVNPALPALMVRAEDPVRRRAQLALSDSQAPLE